MLQRWVEVLPNAYKDCCSSKSLTVIIAAFDTYKIQLMGNTVYKGLMGFLFFVHFEPVVFARHSALVTLTWTTAV